MADPQATSTGELIPDEREMAEAQFRRSRRDMVWNIASIGALLLLAVWLAAVEWSFTARALWTANAVFTFVAVWTIPKKVSLIRSIQADTDDAGARRIVRGTLTNVLLQDAVVVTLQVWTGFKVWSN